MHEYTVLMERDEDDWFCVQCLELPGAISQGKTEEEALVNIKEAIELILESIKEDAAKQQYTIKKVVVDV